MYSRHVSCQLKAIKPEELTQMFDREILPLLQKQNGFNDEITFVDQDRRQVLAISLWDNKESAEVYSRETYPQVLKTLGRVIEGTPQVRSYEVAFSTLHRTSATI
jgi:heme-degrading monooxygenase HmoA